jgi:hypothetical protein
MEKRRQPEIIAGRVNADGSIAAGDGFTVQKGGVGAYTLFLAPGFRAISCPASCTAVNQAACANVQSDRQVSVNVYLCSTGALADLAFSFTAVGIQT